MSLVSGPVIPLKPVAPAAPPAGRPSGPPSPWRWGQLLLAPHRLAFFLAMVLLLASGLWWALVQVDRVSGLVGLSYALSPSLVHAAVMTLGFLPLFFGGFLFTAGPKWLGLGGVEARGLLPMWMLQAVGWLLWLAGAHIHPWMAVGGAALALAGLTEQSLRFWALVRRSRAEDRLHAKVVATAGSWGALCLGGLLLATLVESWELARLSVLSGLWGYILVVFVVVAHRMIPFFTSSAVPMVHAWRPFWVLWLMLAAAALELVAVWVPWFVGGLPGRGWMLFQGLAELVLGGVILWLGLVWGLVQSLKIRLLAMLHLGFFWLGLSFLLAGASQLLGLGSGVPALALGALHALTMGCLGSLVLAMVTRVSCGHSGRTLVADGLVWTLFWVLQVAVLLRIAATLQQAPGWVMLLASLLWAGLMLVWGVRLSSWYGRLRSDGRPG